MRILLAVAACLLFSLASTAGAFTYPGLFGSQVFSNGGDGYCGWGGAGPPAGTYGLAWKGFPLAMVANGVAQTTVNSYSDIYTILVPIEVSGDPDCGDYTEGWQLVSTTGDMTSFPQVITVQYYFFLWGLAPAPESYQNWLAEVQASQPLPSGDDDVTDQQLAAVFTHMSTNTAVITQTAQATSQQVVQAEVMVAGFLLAVVVAATWKW